MSENYVVSVAPSHFNSAFMTYQCALLKHRCHFLWHHVRCADINF